MKTALVTGGAKGLGKEVCLQLAKKGISLVIHYRKSQSEAQALKTHCEAMGVKATLIQADFTKDINALLNLNVDHLVNNVGEFFLGPLASTPIEELYQVNFFAPLKLMLSLPLTSALNIGVTGLDKTFRTSPAYHMTKRSLLDATRTLAAEKKFRANMVSPAYMENSAYIPKGAHAIPCATVAERVVTTLLDPTLTGQNIEVE